MVFDHAYHGRTNLTMALTAKNQPYKSGFGPFAPEVYRVPMSYPFHDGLSGAEAAKRAISQIEKQVGAENTAAVLIEPIQGEGGFVVPARGVPAASPRGPRANGVVFIADEVQTGFARTGAMFASEHEGVVPDVVTTAKGIAGGLPLSAVTGRADDHGLRRTSAASAGRTAATRSRAPQPSPRSTRSSTTGSSSARAAIEHDPARRAADARRRTTRASATSAAAGR